MQTESIARGLIQSIFAYALYHTYAHAEAQQPRQQDGVFTDPLDCRVVARLAAVAPQAKQTPASFPRRQR